jgi:hypothetical protein
MELQCVEAVEGHDLVLGVNVVVHSPAVVSIIVILLLDEILEAAPMDAAVKDLVNL